MITVVLCTCKLILYNHMPYMYQLFVSNYCYLLYFYIICLLYLLHVYCIFLALEEPSQALLPSTSLPQAIGEVYYGTVANHIN